MKAIKLTGRERTVLRYIDETAGSTGQEIAEQAHLDEAEIPEVLNGLINAGYVEAFAPEATLPLIEEISVANVHDTRFEVNPAYITALRQATRRSLS